MAGHVGGACGMPVPSSGPLWHSQLGAGRGGAGICLRPHQQGFASVLFSPDQYDSLKTSWASCVSDYNSLQWVKAAQTHRSETSFLCLGLWDMALKGFWRLLVKPGESKCYDSQKPSHLAKVSSSAWRVAQPCRLLRTVAPWRFCRVHTKTWPQPRHPPEEMST